MPTRVYYWMKGAPPDRPGGPWWYKDFHSDIEAYVFISDLWQFTKDIRTLKAAQLPEQETSNCAPPVEARSVK